VQQNTNYSWKIVDTNREKNWLTHRMKIPNGWLYKTVDKFHVTDKDGIISMTDWKVTVTFVPE
jgi:hypothetical protein